VIPAPAVAQRKLSPEDSAEAAVILRELIGIRSVTGTPGTVEAANAVAARLRKAGFSDEDVVVVGPTPQLASVVARLKGRGAARPILLLAHIDVVDARREDWTTDPFTLVEKDGWWYGRGTGDDKGPAVMIVENLVRWKRAGFVPRGDVIAVFTTDEETNSNAIKWFASGAGRRWIDDPEFALNEDAGGGDLDKSGNARLLAVQTGEKVYQSYRLEVKNVGGHSSLPRRDNAIYTLASALGRLAAFRFPVELNETTRSYFRQAAAFEKGQLAADMRAVSRPGFAPAAAARLSVNPHYNALLRTTCVATRLEGGHADNALPQTARAIVNCRILPGVDPDRVDRTLTGIIADTAVHVSRVAPPTASPPSPLSPRVLDPITRVAHRLWPGIPIIPEMSTGATDGLYVRNAGIPVYGTTGVFTDPDEARAHGKDERIEIKRFYEGLEYLRLLVEELMR
jgi:acetylornithine deacetylase/succinyl-diaminopimelate desuccinylase-like protein